MNKYAENHKAKGISVEGFWSRLKDKTEKRPGETDCPSGSEHRDSPDLSEPNSQPHTGSRDVSAANASKESYTDDDWVARFDEWLDGL